MNEKTFLRYRRYHYGLRQQKLQLSKTFRDYYSSNHANSSESREKITPLLASRISFNIITEKKFREM